MLEWSRFPWLESPGKSQNKIPGLSRFSRTHKNPVMKNNLSTSVIVRDLKVFFGGGEGKLANSVGGEVLVKKKSPDLSFPEVSICDVIPPIQMSLCFWWVYLLTAFILTTDCCILLGLWNQIYIQCKLASVGESFKYTNF